MLSAKLFLQHTERYRLTIIVLKIEYNFFYSLSSLKTAEKVEPSHQDLLYLPLFTFVILLILGQ